MSDQERAHDAHREQAPSSSVRAALRALPSVDDLARALRTGETHAASCLEATRAILAEARVAIQQGAPPPSREELLARVSARLLERERPALRPVINATGVILNTNLGRSPLSAAAVEAMRVVAASYSNLEYDLETGERGSRQAHVRALLCELTGAEAALVVNNNASAVLVVLSALAAGREVVLSRGELVEIGGGFRVPDVMRQSGAHLVEVGTTNRTRARDFAAALTPQTALLLSVHPSNFRILGFTEAPALTELASLAHEHHLPLVHDLGSGCLMSTERWGLAHEPTPHESLAAGADIVCFSGDKLLGGPQAGLIVGRSEPLARIASHPLMRAMRIDKLTLAALEATLRHYRDGEAEVAIPIWQAISAPLDHLRARAEKWAEHARTLGLAAEVAEGESQVGGGSLPGETLPTALCRVSFPTARRGNNTVIPEIGLLSARLRRGDPPVVARVSRDALLLDPRTVAPDQDDVLKAVLAIAISSLVAPQEYS